MNLGMHVPFFGQWRKSEFRKALEKDVKREMAL